jgi:hypothetical protein
MSALASRSSARVSRDATVQTHEVNTVAPLLRSSTGSFHANKHTAMHGAASARLPTLTCANLVYSATDAAREGAAARHSPPHSRPSSCLPSRVLLLKSQPKPRSLRE